MKLNRVRKFISDNMNNGTNATTIVFADSDVRVRVELLSWPLQATPSITVLIEDLDLTLDGDVGILKTVNFSTDHIESNLESHDFHIPEREGFKDTSITKIQEYLAKEWNA